VTSGLSAATFRQVPLVHDITGPFVLGAREKVVLQAEVGPAFRRALQTVDAEDEMQIFLQTDAWTQLSAQFHTDTKPIPVQFDRVRPHTWQPVDKRFARSVLWQGSCLTVEIENCSDEPVHMGAWQRAALPGRDQHVLPVCRPERSYPLLLGIEIRMMRPDKTFALVGF